MEKNKLTAYALNELNEIETKEVEAYLALHPEEKMEVEQIKMVSQILKSELATDYKIAPPPFKEANQKVSLLSFWRSKKMIAAMSFSIIGITSYLLLTEVQKNTQMNELKLIPNPNLMAEQVAIPVEQEKPTKMALNKDSVNVAQEMAVDMDMPAANSTSGATSAVPSVTMADSSMPEQSRANSFAAGSLAAKRKSVGAYDKMGGMAGGGTLGSGSTVAMSPPMYEGGFPGSSEEQYESVSENGFIEVAKEPLSTFSIDVDTASYSNARRFLSYGQLPPRDSIRTEEFVNYFDYDYAAPTSAHPISINMEAVTSPWDKEKVLVKVGLKAKEISQNQRPKSNLVFLIDVSGSMSDENKLPLVKSAMRTLTSQMSEQDKISIVVYAGQSGVVLDSTSASNKDKIVQAINNLSTGGGTNGEGGIRKAYEIAQKNFIKDGNNRVLLATDGDFNVGTTSSDELLKIINDKSENGIFLTVLGFGMGNYKDAFLEKISNKGQGNYFYIDNEKEANKVFITQLAGTLYTLAKDVKIQIEFNPNVVSSYRLVGYENRKLNKEDFSNDKIDAGELGAGHSVTALYELVMKGKEGSNNSPEPLKYQKLEEKKEKIKVSPELTAEILTAKFRYKKPKNTSSEYFDQALKNEVKSIENATCSTKFATSVASFAQWLKKSEHVQGFDSGKILKLTEGCLSTNDRKDSFKEEYVVLVKKASQLQK